MTPTTPSLLPSNQTPRWWGRVTRWCARYALALAATLVVLYPRLDLTLRQIGHLQDWDRLIDPTLPALGPINAEIDAKLPPGCPAAQEMQAVQQWVYNHIPYRFDWVTWGNIDYWPTAAEVLEHRMEDCDGQAVLAASLLRARGFATAHLQGNLSHVWVALAPNDPKMKVDHPVTAMNPVGRAVFARHGGKLALQLPDWASIRPALIDGGQFPASRIALIAAIWLVTIAWPQRRWSRLPTAGALVSLGLWLWTSWSARVNHFGNAAGDAELILVALLIVAGFCAVAWRRKDQETAISGGHSARTD
jgi:predicted transglutaminase-like cysteine proteinase